MIPLIGKTEVRKAVRMKKISNRRVSGQSGAEKAVRSIVAKKAARGLEKSLSKPVPASRVAQPSQKEIQLRETRMAQGRSSESLANLYNDVRNTFLGVSVALAARMDDVRDSKDLTKADRRRLLCSFDKIAVGMKEVVDRLATIGRVR